MSDSESDPNKVPQRTWMGIPVNSDWKNWNKGVWNTDDHRLFPPKRVGIGWTIYTPLLRRLRRGQRSSPFVRSC